VERNISRNLIKIKQHEKYVVTARGKPRTVKRESATALTSFSAVISCGLDALLNSFTDQVPMMQVTAIRMHSVMLVITHTNRAVNLRHIGSISREVIASTT
jgi:fructosamine-3-kinase